MGDDAEEAVLIPRLMRDARGSYAQVIHEHLHRVNCQDLPRHGPYVVGGLNGGTSAGLIFREMGLGERQRERLLSALLQSGFVEPGAGAPSYSVPDLVNTARGTAAANAVWEGIQEVSHQLKERLTDEEMRGLVAGLRALCDIKKEHGERDHYRGAEHDL